MKKRWLIAGCVCVLTGACSSSKIKISNAAPSKAESTQVVATIDDTSITDAELSEAAANQLQKVQTQVYEIKRRALDNLVEEKLIALAAKKQGLTSEAYVKAQINDKLTPVTEAEMKALYDARKGKDAEPYEKVKDQISNYLSQSRRAQERNKLISQLKTQSTVKILMEPPRVEVETADSPAIGPKNAKVTMIEFSDYQCPFCHRVRPTIAQINKDYKDKIRYVFRDFPLSFHTFSPKAHEAAHCAGEQNKYFEYNDKLFNNQSQLTVDDLKKDAKQLQLNTKKFDACLDSGKYADQVQRDIESGVAAGVSGTPAYFINGIMLSGAQPYEAFKEIIDSELNR